VSKTPLEKARRATFHFDDDTSALRMMMRRLAAKAREQPDSVIAYSDLVRGIVFHIPTVLGGAPIELGVPEWSRLHQSIIGGCLGRLSCDTYIEGGFLISAVAVSKVTLEPSDGFNALLEMLQLVSSKRDPRCTEMWIEHLHKTYAWCRQHPQWPEG